MDVIELQEGLPLELRETSEQCAHGLQSMPLLSEYQRLFAVVGLTSVN